MVGSWARIWIRIVSLRRNDRLVRLREDGRWRSVYGRVRRVTRRGRRLRMRMRSVSWSPAVHNVDGRAMRSRLEQAVGGM